MNNALILSIAASSFMGAHWSAADFKPTIHPSRLNFQWRNQRQIRKNRRRAHAAGCKRAFK